VLPEVTALRYVTPLREGGSLPGVMEADDEGTYVVKFTGAGQGPRTLVAEVVCAGLLRALDLPVPDLVVIDLDPALSIGEPDEEVQDLLRASPGRNLGMDFLPGALDLDVRAFPLDPALAGQILWFDALVGNVDRSWRNPNMLCWHRKPYLIDHGATLTFAHHWPGAAAWITRPYDAREHAVRGCSPDVVAADAQLAGRLAPEMVAAAVADVPDEWLVDAESFGGLAQVRQAYAGQLLGRLEARHQWLPALIGSLA
jgi:hypothetical protein